MLHMFTYLNMFYFMFHTHVGSAVVLLSWGQFGRQPAGSVYLWSSLLHKQLILQNGAERLNQLIIVCDDTQRNHWPRRKPDDNKLNRHISWKPIFFTSLQQFNSVTAFNNIFHVLMFNDLTCCHISFMFHVLLLTQRLFLSFFTLFWWETFQDCSLRLLSVNLQVIL